jgi:hypothetical protein
MMSRPTSNAATVATTGTAIFSTEPDAIFGAPLGGWMGGIANVLVRLSM